MTLGTFGAYRLISRIGSGAIAEVFLAAPVIDGAGPARVALKRMAAHVEGNEEVRELFRREGELLGRFDHRGIPRLHAMGQVGAAWYLALELAEGTRLDTLRAVAPSTALPLDAACGIVLQLCAALHHAHESRAAAGSALGVVHRDVAPHNVIVASDGSLKLIDFGVAALAGAVDAVPRGSPGYMAPEQVLGDAVDRRADVFALGVLLYELTVGVPPFEGDALARMTGVVERDAAPPSRRLPEFSGALEAIVLDALRRRRDARIASAAELGDRLAAFCSDAGIVASPVAIGRWAGTRS